MDGNVIYGFPKEELVDSIVAKLIPHIQAILGEQERDKLLSPTDACKMFIPAISTKTLARWTKDGLIVVQRVGGRLYYKHSDLLTAGSTLKRYKPTRT